VSESAAGMRMGGGNSRRVSVMIEDENWEDKLFLGDRSWTLRGSDKGLLSRA